MDNLLNIFDRVWNSPDLKNIEHKDGTYLDHLVCYDEVKTHHKMGLQQERIIRPFRKVLGIPELVDRITKNSYKWRGD